MKRLILFLFSAVLTLSIACFAGMLALYMAEIPSADQVFVQTADKALNVSSTKVISKLPVKNETPEERLEKIVSEFVEKANNFERNITIEIYDFPADTVADAILEEGLCSSLSWTSRKTIAGTSMAITPEYKLTHEIRRAVRTGDESKLSYKAKVVYDEVKAVIDEHITEGMSDFEKELAIHDYLVKTAEYDVRAAETASSTTNERPDAFSPYGILLDRTGVCQGYAEAMVIFMDVLGIECEEVVGTAGGVPHAWNRIKIGGEYYNIDVTWNDPTNHEKGEISYAYFNVTDEMLARDHVFDVDENKKSVSETYNYFTYNNLLVNNRQDLARILSNAKANGDAYTEVRLVGFELDRNALRGAAADAGMNSILYSENKEQNVVKFYLQ